MPLLTRSAQRSDRRAIANLLRRAHFTTPHLWRWQGHLGEDGFVLSETRGRIEGALLALADESPVAWVRVAAVADSLEIGDWLDASLPPIVGQVAATGAEALAWMDYQGWAGRYLAERGFAPAVRVVTLDKKDRAIPDGSTPPVRLRQPTKDDFAMLADIDRRAFTPMWWRSESSVRQRGKATSRFTVAELEGEVVGYAEWECGLSAAHVNRLAVDPRYQGRGIGALLLTRVLEALWNCGAQTVSLNTQASNHRSQRLYDRFNFRPTGESVIVWSLPLTDAISASGNRDSRPGTFTTEARAATR